MNDDPLNNMAIEGAGRPSEEQLQARVEAAMNMAQSNRAAQQVQPMRFESFSDPNAPVQSIDMLMDVTLQLTVELGRTRMTVKDVLDLQNGSVVELDRLAGEAVDIFVNDHKLARGEVVVVDDKFGVRITELISPKQRAGEK